MEFSYQARDNEGKFRLGRVEAVNESAAFSALENHGFIVVKITPINQTNFFAKAKFFDRVSPKEIVIFSRQLATLIGAKVPIVQALRILQDQVSANKLKIILSEIAVRVENGESLSSAIVRYPKIFSELYVNLVRSAEISGTLGDSLEYLASQLERDYDLRSKVLGALAYPAFILVALIIVGFLMFLYVLPPLVAILQESSVDLPFTTKILISTTNFIQNFWYLVILAMVGIVVGVRAYVQTTGGRYVYDTLKLKVPLINGLFQKIYMARFSRNLATLLSGGIPIVLALQSVADIVGNVIYRDIFMDAARQVTTGKGMASVFLQYQEIPPVVAQMTQIGESTGELTDILSKLAAFYEKEVEAVLKVLTTLLEPFIMVLLGLVVATVVAGILLPMYNLASAV